VLRLCFATNSSIIIINIQTQLWYWYASPFVLCVSLMQFCVFVHLDASAVSRCFLAGFFSTEQSTAAAMVFATMQSFSHRITETIFSQLCGIFQCFFCVCSISPSQWMGATIFASSNKTIKKQSLLIAAPIFHLFRLFYALRVWSHKPIHAAFLNGGIPI